MPKCHVRECFCKIFPIYGDLKNLALGGVFQKWPSKNLVSLSGIMPEMGWDLGSCKRWLEGTLKNFMLDCTLRMFYLKHTPSWAEFGCQGRVGPSEGRVGPSEGQVGPSEGWVGLSEGRVGQSEGRVVPSEGGVGPSVTNDIVWKNFKLIGQKALLKKCHFAALISLPQPKKNRLNDNSNVSHTLVFLSEKIVLLPLTLSWRWNYWRIFAKRRIWRTRHFGASEPGQDFVSNFIIS